MSAPVTTARLALISAMDTEFVPTEVTAVLDDRISPALGIAKPIAAVFPLREDVNEQNGAVLDVFLGVQVYLQWDKKVDPAQKVSPQPIEDIGHRLRELLRDLTGDDNMWYFNLVDVRYPPDPTGNVSRLEATVMVQGRNNELFETV